MNRLYGLAERGDWYGWRPRWFWKRWLRWFDRRYMLVPEKETG